MGWLVSRLEEINVIVSVFHIGSSPSVVETNPIKVIVPDYVVQTNDSTNHRLCD